MVFGVRLDIAKICQLYVYTHITISIDGMVSYDILWLPDDMPTHKTDNMTDYIPLPIDTK
jgi:hypothetical protein